MLVPSALGGWNHYIPVNFVILTLLEKLNLDLSQKQRFSVNLNHTNKKRGLTKRSGPSFSRGWVTISAG